MPALLLCKRSDASAALVKYDAMLREPRSRQHEAPRLRNNLEDNSARNLSSSPLSDDFSSRGSFSNSKKYRYKTVVKNSVGKSNFTSPVSRLCGRNVTETNEHAVKKDFTWEQRRRSIRRLPQAKKGSGCYPCDSSASRPRLQRC